MNIKLMVCVIALVLLDKNMLIYAPIPVPVPVPVAEGKPKTSSNSQGRFGFLWQKDNSSNQGASVKKAPAKQKGSNVLLKTDFNKELQTDLRAKSSQNQYLELDSKGKPRYSEADLIKERDGFVKKKSLLDEDLENITKLNKALSAKDRMPLSVDRGALRVKTSPELLKISDLEVQRYRLLEQEHTLKAQAKTENKSQNLQLSNDLSSVQQQLNQNRAELQRLKQHLNQSSVSQSFGGIPESPQKQIPTPQQQNPSTVFQGSSAEGRGLPKATLGRTASTSDLNQLYIHYIPTGLHTVSYTSYWRNMGIFYEAIRHTIYRAFVRFPLDEMPFSHQIYMAFDL